MWKFMGVFMRTKRLLSFLLVLSVMISMLSTLNVSAASAITDVSSVESSGGTTYFIKSDRTLWVVGYNPSGQLGVGDKVTRTELVQVLDNVRYVRAESSTVIALKFDGTLWATGSNYWGQFGNGTSRNEYLIWTKIASNVVSAEVGQSNIYYLTKNGTLYGSGYGGSGGLGDGSTSDSLAFKSIATDVVKVKAGASTVYILKKDKQLYYTGFIATGNNTKTWKVVGSSVSDFYVAHNTLCTLSLSGNLITGTYPSISPVAYASVDNYGARALKTDGTLWSIGTNQYGQLGDGTTTDNTSTWTQVASDVRFVDFGGAATFIIKNDNSLTAVGYNANGNLGDGTTNNALSWTTIVPSHSDSLDDAYRAVDKAENSNIQDDVDAARSLVEVTSDPHKMNLTSRLDTVQSIVDYNNKVSAATTAVVRAESTKTQVDTYSARDLVSLLVNPEKASLTTRLDVVQAAIDLIYPTKLQDATLAVIKAETTKTPVDIAMARFLVNDLKEPDKTNLGSRLNTLDGGDYPTKVTAATQAVEKAEVSKNQADIDAAKILVDKLNEPEKTALSNRLDIVQQEINNVYQQKLTAAASAVIKAELSNKQIDVDAARLLVADLKTVDKTLLNGRLDIVQAYIDAAYNVQLDSAIASVVKAETTLLQVDVDAARILVNALKPTDRDPLLERLGIVQAVIDSQYSQLVNNATGAVVQAESSKTQADVSAARTLVNKLKEIDKGPLNARLDAVQAAIDAAAGYAIQLANATSAVGKAEVSKLQSDIDTARVLVNALHAEDIPSLIARLDAIQIEIDNAYQQKLTIATTAVVKAESTLNQVDLDNARILVNGLKAADRESLSNRLDVVQNLINTAVYQNKVTAATQAVVKAESTKYQLDVDVARDLVKKLNEPEKSSLEARLDAVQLIIDTNYNLKVQAATAAVEKAEVSKTSYDILAAKNIVAQLHDPEKTELSNRLDLIVPVNLQQIVPVVNTFKSVYALNESLDITGAKLQLIYDNGSTNTVSVTVDMILGFTTSSIGSKTMNILYQGKTAIVNYTVQEQTEPVIITAVCDDSTYSSSKVITVSTTGKVGHIELPNGAKIYKNSLSYSVTSNGNYSFSAVGKDGVSADSAIVTVTKIDTQAPVLSFQWPQSSFSSVTMSAIDVGSGVDKVVTPDGVEHTEVPFGYTLSNGTGTVTCYDLAGNVTTKDLLVNNIYIGVTGTPTYVALSGIPKEWTNSDIPITAAAYNPVDGVNSVTILGNGETFAQARMSRTAVASITPTWKSKLDFSDTGDTSAFDTFSLRAIQRLVALNTTPVFDNTTIGANGQYSYVVNNALGSYTDTFNINNIDKTSPEVTAAISHNNTNGESTVTYTVSDTLSGIKSIILPDGQEIVIPTDKQFNYNGVFAMTANGNFDIYVKDYAGNITSKTVSMDNTVVTPPVNPPGNGGGNNGGGSGGGNGGGSGGSGGSGGGGGGPSGGNTNPTTPTTPTNPTNPTVPVTPTPVKPTTPVIVIREDIPLLKEINGYIAGYSEFKFGPNDNITRAQLATMLYKITGGTTKYKDTQYRDVSKHWARPGINFVVDKGLMTGVDSKNFYPNQEMTRKEVAVVIYKFLDVEKSQTVTQKEFADINGIEGEKEIKYLSSLNVVNGNDGKYRPQDKITRAEIVVIINNILGDRLVTKNKSNFKDIEKHWGRDAINKAYCK